VACDLHHHEPVVAERDRRADATLTQHLVTEHRRLERGVRAERRAARTAQEHRHHAGREAQILADGGEIRTRQLGPALRLLLLLTEAIGGAVAPGVSTSITKTDASRHEPLYSAPSGWLNWKSAFTYSIPPPVGQPGLTLTAESNRIRSASPSDHERRAPITTLSTKLSCTIPGTWPPGAQYGASGLRCASPKVPLSSTVRSCDASLSSSPASSALPSLSRLPSVPSPSESTLS
jgi:hypothetical protein